MESEPMVEQVTMIQPLTVEDFKSNPKIQRARNNLLIVIGIHLGLIIICGFIAIIAVALKNTESNPFNLYRSTNFVVNVSNFVSIIFIATYYVIFIIVVKENSRLGLLIFTCLTLAALIIIIGFIVVILFTLIEQSKYSISPQYGSGHMIPIIAFCVYIVLSVLTIVFALKLAKLIKTPTTNQPFKT